MENIPGYTQVYRLMPSGQGSHTSGFSLIQPRLQMFLCSKGRKCTNPACIRQLDNCLLFLLRQCRAECGHHIVLCTVEVRRLKMPITQSVAALCHHIVLCTVEGRMLKQTIPSNYAITPRGVY
jgi:hypothetical protein